jgi:hypothetical protein
MTGFGRSLLQAFLELAAFQQLLYSFKPTFKWQEFGNPVRQHPARSGPQLGLIKMGGKQELFSFTMSVEVRRILYSPNCHRHAASELQLYSTWLNRPVMCARSTGLAVFTARSVWSNSINLLQVL